MTLEELHDNLTYEAHMALEEWARILRSHDCADHRDLLDRGAFTLHNLNAHTAAWEAYGKYLAFETACRRIGEFIKEQAE